MECGGDSDRNPTRVENYNAREEVLKCGIAGNGRTNEPNVTGNYGRLRIGTTEKPGDFICQGGGIYTII